MKYRVLLMEDDLDQLGLLHDTFLSAGFKVTATSSATEALAVVRNAEFDLIITDIFVQQDGEYTADGGIYLIGKLRGPEVAADNPWCKDVPILAISGGAIFPGQEYLLNMTESVGATLAVAKPIDARELLKISKELIEKSKIEP